MGLLFGRRTLSIWTGHYMIQTPNLTAAPLGEYMAIC